MNDHLHVGPHGLRLLQQWEAGPRDGSVPLSPNGAALRAYLCPGGKWTLGWGCTEWPDGQAVKRGDTLQNEEQAEALLAYNLIRFEEAVKHLATVPLTQYQFDAHVCFAFNIGVSAYAECSALDAANDGNHDLAASKFGLFTGATSTSPTRAQINDPVYAEIIQESVSSTGKTVYHWKGPDGQRCGLMDRLSGLLARHYSEGLLSLGLDWTEACKPGVIQLRTVPVSRRKWNAGRNRWELDTLKKTEFAEVLAVARRYPLSDPEPEPEDWMFDANVPLPEREDEDPALPDAWAEAGEDMPPISAPSVREPPSPAPNAAAAPDTPKVSVPVAVPAAPAPVGTKPIHPESKPAAEVPYKIDPDAPLKPMEFTERFVGAAWMYVATWLKVGSKNVAMFTGPIGLGLVALMEFLNTPAGMAAASALTVMVICGVLYAFGWRLDKNGLRKKKRGEESATQAMF